MRKMFEAAAAAGSAGRNGDAKGTDRRAKAMGKRDARRRKRAARPRFGSGLWVSLMLEAFSSSTRAALPGFEVPT